VHNSAVGPDHVWHDQCWSYIREALYNTDVELGWMDGVEFNAPLDTV